ncbi:hypothetical protein Q3G72_000610 [Acer saccharum]|nr:hypothetical protein Q3G72_000610 [Acer saccharum]
MCVSPIVQSAFNFIVHRNDSISQISCSGKNYYDSDSQLEIVDELRRDDSSLEVSSGSHVILVDDELGVLYCIDVFDRVSKAKAIAIEVTSKVMAG